MQNTGGIIDDQLYIVGGLAVYETHVTANTLLRSLDLTKPFSLNSKTPLPFTEFDIPSEVPESTQASLWADVNKKQLVLFPGNAVDGLGIRGFNAPKISEYWVYDIVRKTWSSFVAQGVSLGATMATAWVDKLQRGFMVGGVLKSDQVVLPGNLVTFDAEKNNWANETTNNVAERFQAQLVYVEGVGSEGILVVLGGLGKGYNTQSVSARNPKATS